MAAHGQILFGTQTRKKKVKIDDKIHLFLPVEADIILVVKHI
jgi:hypothetical protein